MSKDWEEIARLALRHWRYMETLDNRDKQLLMAFHTFRPAFAYRKHMIIRLKRDVVRQLLETIGEPGGVWLCYDPIPFDEQGRPYAYYQPDYTKDAENFKLWALPKNQEVVYEFAERRYDEQAFSAIFPARTKVEIIHRINELDPFCYPECLDAFEKLLPELGWEVIILRPTGDFGLFVVDDNQGELMERVKRRFDDEGIEYFELLQRGDRFYWEGPTIWD